MSIEAVCPDCDATYNLPDTQRGKKVRCKKCDSVFTVTAPARKPARRPAKDDEEVEVLPVRAVKRPAAVKPRRRDDEDDDEHEDEDEDEDDRPRKKGGGGLILLLLVGGGLAALLLVGVGIVVFAGGDGTPRKNPPVAEGGNDPNPPVPTPVKTDKDPPKTDKDPPKIDPQAGGGGPGAGASGQAVYRYLLKSTTWVMTKVGSRAKTGTGSLIDETNRLILTNYHVVSGGEDYVIFFPTFEQDKLVAAKEEYLKQVKKETVLHGKVLVTDPRHDLALIQVEKLPPGVEALPIASGSVSPGQQVHSVGNPGASDGLWVYTSGTVRQVYHKKWQAVGGVEIFDLESDVVETQSPTNPGDSGGPLVSDTGELVAVTEGGNLEANLLSTFIDVKEVKDFIHRYEQAAKVTWVPATRTPLSAHRNAEGQIVDLIGKLGNTDAKDRAQAAQALGALGSDARVAIPSLVKLLGDRNDLVKQFARGALTKIGPPAKGDVGVLVGLLADPAPEVRQYAAETLGVMGADARPAAGALATAVQDKDPRVREQALRTLAKLGPPVHDKVMQGLTDALKDPERNVRSAAGEVLGLDLGLTGADLPFLTDALKHEDVDVRAGAARALGKVGPDAKSAVKPLVALLKENDRGLRKAALEGLAGIGSDSKEALPEVEKALKEADKDLRRAAVDVVGKLGPDAKDAVPLVVPLLRESDVEVRRAAIVALGRVGPAAGKDATAGLAEQLGDLDNRTYAMTALAAVKPSDKDAKPAVTRLVALLEDKNKDVMARAAQTLGAIGKPAVPDLVKALKGSADANVRAAVATALGEVGPDAKDALQILLVYSQQDTEQSVRDAASKAVLKIRK
jgi:predicted Zn finger-like uncharacterized protein